MKLKILFILLYSLSCFTLNAGELSKAEIMSRTDKTSAFWKTAPDPKKCMVILAPITRVGVRISDAQLVAEIISAAFTKRLGYGAFVYGAMAKDARKMKKMLGRNVTTELQDDQIEYFAQAQKASEFEIKVKFKKKRRGRNKHWLKIWCKRKGDKWKDSIETKEFRAKNFRKVRADLEDFMPEFCLVIKNHKKVESLDSGEKKSLSKEKRRQKKIKAWSPPPMR